MFSYVCGQPVAIRLSSESQAFRRPDVISDRSESRTTALIHGRPAIPHASS